MKISTSGVGLSLHHGRHTLRVMSIKHDVRTIPSMCTNKLHEFEAVTNSCDKVKEHFSICGGETIFHRHCTVHSRPVNMSQRRVPCRIVVRAVL